MVAAGADVPRSAIAVRQRRLANVPSALRGMNKMVVSAVDADMGSLFACLGGKEYQIPLFEVTAVNRFSCLELVFGGAWQADAV